jgi:phytanoyl-CoA hydroxylase
MQSFNPETYLNQGYAVLENFIDDSLRKQLRERAYQLAHLIEEGLVPVFHPQTQTTWTHDEIKATTRGLCCFWEDPGSAKPRLLKLSHALHKLDPLVYEFTISAKIKDLLCELSIVQPQIVQTQLHFKPPHSASGVSWHQDASYIMTHPCTTTGLWLALEDATVENGCLTVIPGAHKQGLVQQMKRTPAGELFFTKIQENNWDTMTRVSLPVPAGTLIVLHGLCPHKSDANTSQNSRLSLTTHFFDLSSKYAEENWLPLEML